GLAGRAGPGEPEPHMALMLLGGLVRALVRVVGPGALAPAVLAGVHRRVADPGFPDPVDDVRRFSRPSAPVREALLVRKSVGQTSRQSSRTPNLRSWLSRVRIPSLTPNGSAGAGGVSGGSRPLC